MENNSADYYSKEGLRTLQLIELRILREFDEVCRANGLEYALVGGCMIGQARNGGFVPWDDDVDVAMPRADYEKFIRIADEQYSDRYYINNNDHNNNYPFLNTQWGLKGTTYRTADMADFSGTFGIFLDIFPYDNVADDDRAMRRQITKAWFWGKMLVLSGVRHPHIYLEGWKAKVLRAALVVTRACMKTFGVSTRRLYLKSYKYATMYRDTDTRRMNVMMDSKRYATLVDKDVYFPSVRGRFENIEVNLARQQHVFLTQYYGDYMQLPPVEKRKTHPPLELDFGPYAELVADEVRRSI